MWCQCINNRKSFNNRFNTSTYLIDLVLMITTTTTRNSSNWNMRIWYSLGMYLIRKITISVKMMYVGRKRCSAKIKKKLCSIGQTHQNNWWVNSNDYNKEYPHWSIHLILNWGVIKGQRVGKQMLLIPNFASLFFKTMFTQFNYGHKWI